MQIDSLFSFSQMFGFLLYESSYIAKKSGNILKIPKVIFLVSLFI